MPGNGRPRSKSVGVQCFLDKEISKGRGRRYSERGSSFSRRVIKTPGYRNLLRNTISVIPNQHERLSLSEQDRSKGIQTNLGDEISSLGNQQRAESSFRNPLYERRHRDASLQIAGTASTAGSPFRERSSFLDSHEEPLTTLFRDDESGVSAGDDDLAFLNETMDIAGSSRRSNENDSIREDYLSYDIRNAAGRQVTESEGRNETASTKSPCCRKKRRSPPVLSRPIPIVIDEHLPKRESTLSCRICHEGNEVEPLIQPCLCKGSVGNVHAKCLKNWLEQSSTSRCELCNYPYAIRQTKKSLMYDAVSFCVITPLAAAGIAVCAQASVRTASPDNQPESAVHMGNVTRAGMIMLSGTIIVAYGIWLFTLASSYYKSWKKWYDNCYDVEVIPVRMTSQDRREASTRIYQEREGGASRDPPPRIFSIFQGQNVQPPNYHRRMTISVVRNLPR